MFHGVCDASDVDAVLAQADVIAVGPGLGRSDWARALLQHVLRQRQGGQRLVVDADALNLIAEGVALQRCADWVLTPHPGEAARLLGIYTEAVQEDRLAALSALCKQRGGTIVLKGAATLIRQTGSIPLLCEKGNPGMAVPGMGDVLTGALTGLLAQGAEPFAAAAAAVYAHAVAGDRCARNGVRGVLALDVARELRAVLALLP
jgi:NAD(P)H-hydrate epimerase